MADLKRIVVTGAGGGYSIIQENGTPLPAETTIDFTGAGVTVTDNPGVATIVNIPGGAPTGYQTIDNAGTPLTQRTVLNFSGSGVTAVDNAGATRTDVSLAATLVDVAGLTPSANSIITGNGTHFVDTVSASTNAVYVSSATGNDTTGNGTVLFPYATIGKGVSVAPVEGSVLIAPGTYAESLNFAGITQLILVAAGGSDYTSVFITGNHSFTSTSNHIVFKGIGFSNSSAVICDINASAHISFQQCVFNATAATNPAITVRGAITGEMDIRDCIITGTVTNQATAFFQVYITNQQSSACNITCSNGATIVLNCPNIGLVTHSGGIIELNNIAGIMATAGNSITSTANAGATNQFFLFDSNLQQSDLSYGTLVKSGTCIYVIGGSNYNPTTTFTGTRNNFGSLANDQNANYTPANYTAVNGSVQGNLHGIDNALGSITSGAFPWTVVTGTTQTLAKTNGYFANNAGSVTFSLPATSAVGDTYQVQNMQGGFSIAQGAGQSIQVGNQVTTTGAGGSITSTALGNWIEIVCNVTNNGFVANFKQGELTIV